VTDDMYDDDDMPALVEDDDSEDGGMDHWMDNTAVVHPA
jgi:hypothetical protein